MTGVQTCALPICRVAALEEADFSRRAADLADTGDVLLFEPEMPPDSLRRLCAAVLSRCGGRCAVFAGSDEGGYKYALGQRDGDLRQLARDLNAALAGRGGGKPDFIQGTAAAPRTQIEMFFADKT